ncbi:MAG: MFS transporter, partial [Candidatus Diapherotrites archaeon]|nr:MFS transporter [Candidatus Diapherotrites archaeon]
MNTQLEHKLNSNIWKYYASGAFQSFWFMIAIHILYYQSFGLSYTQIGFFEFIGAITIIFLEIPTGALADLISRKLSVFTGTLLTALAIFTIGFGSTPLVFALGFLIWAIGDTFISGAKNALIYDTLIELNRKKEYLKIQGNYHLIATIVLLFAVLIAPTLFTINTRIPYLLMGVFWVISSFFIIAMHEPTKKHEKYSITKHIVQIKEGFTYATTHKMVRWFILFTILLGLPMLVYNSLMTQPYYLEIGYNLTDLGILTAAIYCFASFTASQAHRIEKKIGENKSLLLIAFFHTIGFLLMGLFKTPFVIIAVIFLYMSRDFRWVVLDNYINKHVVSKMRATVLSVGNMLTNFVMMFAYIIGGMLVDTYTIIPVLFGFGIFMAISSIFLFIT